MTAFTDGTTLSAGLLAARLVIGVMMMAHGAQKLFGWFGGHGLNGTAGFFESLGFRPARVFVAAAALTELGSGLLVALGFLGPVGPALMLTVMIVAAGSVHWKNGVFAASNGIEVPLLYSAGAVTLALTGPGLISLDALLGLQPLWTSQVEWVAIAAGVVGGILNLGLRRPALRPAAAAR
jgi:putative oxidoreductase